MKQTIVLILALTLLFACRQKTAVTGEKNVEQTSEQIDTVEQLATVEEVSNGEQAAAKMAVEAETTLATGQTCYQYIKGKDKASLSLKIVGKRVSGNLAYNWFQKDM